MVVIFHTDQDFDSPCSQPVKNGLMLVDSGHVVCFNEVHRRAEYNTELLRVVGDGRRAVNWD